MSSILEHSLRSAASRGRQMVEVCRSRGGGLPTSGPGGGINALAAQLTGAERVASGLGSPNLTAHKEQLAHNFSWTFACVKAIATRGAGQPIRLAKRLSKDQLASETPDKRVKRLLSLKEEYVPKYLQSTREGLELVDAHQILELLECPNELMTRWILIYVTLSSLELTGKAYWWIYKGDRRDGLKWTIFPLPTHWVEPIHKDNQLYAGWTIRMGNAPKGIEVPGDQIVYMYYPDPANPLAALSPLQAAARSVVASEAIGDAQAKAFKNSIWPGMGIRVKKQQTPGGGPPQAPELTKAQRDQVIEQVLTIYGGVLNYNHPLVLDGFIEEVFPITKSPREMDFMRSANLKKEEITQIFGVNPIVMGQVEGANRASSTNAENHFLSGTVNPKLELLSQIWTVKVVPLLAGKNEKLLMYSEPGYAIDPEFELKRQTSMSDRGALKINEFRTANGYAPVKGGSVAIMPSTMTPYDLDVPYVPVPPTSAAGGPPGGKPPLFPSGGDRLGGAGGAPTPNEGKPAPKPPLSKPPAGP